VIDTQKDKTTYVNFNAFFITTSNEYQWMLYMGELATDDFPHNDLWKTLGITSLYDGVTAEIPDAPPRALS